MEAVIVLFLELVEALEILRCVLALIMLIFISLLSRLNLLFFKVLINGLAGRLLKLVLRAELFLLFFGADRLQTEWPLRICILRILGIICLWIRGGVILYLLLVRNDLSLHG